VNEDPQSRFEQALAIDPSVDSSSREGLTGTARSDVYERTRGTEEVTVAPDARPTDEQPRWRRDFSIDWPEDHFIARRDFTRFLVLTSGAFLAGQGFIAAQHLLRANRPAPQRTRVAALSDIPVGSARVFQFPGEHDACVLVRPALDELLAFSQKCTHLSCAVVPRISEGVFHCPCHEGYFDLRTGRNIAGPPPRPLPKIEIEVDGDDVYALSVELRTV
jgi:nitrite reductase/ring-hydroxylating ferredoxin subunit